MAERFFLCAAVAFAFCSQGSAQFVITKGASGASGTSYTWSWTASNPSGYKGASVQIFQRPTNTWITSFSAGGQVNSGPGDIGAINANGGFTVPPGYTWDVWKNTLGDGEANSSAWVSQQQYLSGGGELSGSDQESKKVTVSYFNDKPYAVKIKLVKNGTEVVGGPYTLAPKTGIVQTIVGLGDGDYQVVVQADDLALNDGQWSVAEGATHVASTTPVPNAAVVPHTTPVTPANTVNVPSAENLPATLPTTNNGNVWSPGVGTAATDGLTNTVYREGVDLITKNQERQIKIEEDRDKEMKKDKEAAAANTEVSVQALADLKYGLAKTAVETAMGTTSVAAAPGTGTSSAGMFQITLPAQAGGTVVDVGIFAQSALLNGINMIKLLILGLLTAAFGWWVITEVKSYMKTLVLAPQTRGNTVAGTGGQITGLIGAAVITVILLAAPTAIVALAESGLGFKQTTDILGTMISAGGATGQAVADLLGAFLPLATITAIVINIMVVRTIGLAVMTGAAVAIRWVVPGVAIVFALYATPEAEASVRIVNASTQEIVIEQVGGDTPATVTIPAGAEDVIAQARGSVFDGALADGGRFTFEALDTCNVVIKPGGVPMVAVPSGVWIVYFAMGFSAGCIVEIFGLTYRLLGRVSGSSEIP